MTRWEYRITMHELPARQGEKQERTIECDQAGRCLVHDAFQANVEWLEHLFRHEGKEGWELVQSGYHNRELLCIWKREKESEETG